MNKGEILSIIFPNGVGKPMVFNLITGISIADEGDICFNGFSHLSLEQLQINQRGIACIFQSLRLFLNMSVIANVMAAFFTRTHANLAQIVFRTRGFRHEEERIRTLAAKKPSVFCERLQGYRFNPPAYSLSYENWRCLKIT